MNNLVLSGGSIKGISYLGLIKALYEHPEIYDNITCYAGASIGSLFAALLILKIPYEQAEVCKFVAPSRPIPATLFPWLVIRNFRVSQYLAQQCQKKPHSRGSSI